MIYEQLPFYTVFTISYTIYDKLILSGYLKSDKRHAHFKIQTKETV